MAGADGGGGRQCIGAQGRCAFARRQDQAGRIGRQLDAVLHVLQQGVVVAVVAHQHRTQGLLAVGGYHQAAIAGGGFVDEAVAAGARQRAVGVADGAHVNAQQLQLGGHVGANERIGVLAAELRGDAAGHLVAGGDQAVDAAVPGGALTDGKDVRVRGQALAVDGHAAARTQFQAALAGQGVLRADAGGEDDQVGFEEILTGEVHPVAIFLAGADGLGGFREMHPHAQCFDARLECLAALVIELHRHQARGEFHHVGVEAEGLQRIGGFQAQQAAAHHHATACLGSSSADGVEVGQGTVDQPRVAFGPFDGRHEGIRARRQHQLVEGDAAVGSDHFATLAVDLQYRHAQVQGHARSLVEAGFAQGQGLGVAAGEVLGEMHTVVGAQRLFAEDFDAIATQCAALDQLLHTVVADHAIADDDQRLHIRSGNVHR
ncbi:hypothetical protein D9M69_290550 [compost metagenome]